MAFYKGVGSLVQIGKEAQFGKGVSPTALVDITSESLKVAVEKGDEGSLLASKTQTRRDLLGVTVDGSISFILKPEFAGLLLHAALGGADTATQIESSEKWQHTITLCEAAEPLPSLTVIVHRRAATKAYAGCTIASLSLECAAGDYVKGSIDLRGVKEESGTLNESLKGFTVPSYRCTAATFSVGGESLDIASATLRIDNALEAAPRTYASGLYSGKPQHGRRSVGIAFEIPYTERVEQLKDTYLTAETCAAIELFFTSSNPDYSIQITLPNVSIGSVEANVGGSGILQASIDGEALSVGAEEPIEVVITDKTNTPDGG